MATDSSNKGSGTEDDLVFIEKSDIQSLNSANSANYEAIREPSANLKDNGKDSKNNLRKRGKKDSPTKSTSDITKDINDDKLKSKRTSPLFTYFKDEKTALRRKNPYLLGLPIGTLENTPQNVALYSFISAGFYSFFMSMAVWFYLLGGYKPYYKYYGLLGITGKLKLVIFELSPGIALYIFGTFIMILAKNTVFDNTYFVSNFDRYKEPEDYVAEKDIDGADRELSAPPLLSHINGELESFLPFDALLHAKWLAVGILECFVKHFSFLHSHKEYINVTFYPSLALFVIGTFVSLVAGFCLLNYKYHFSSRGTSLSLSAARGFLYIWIICTQSALSGFVAFFATGLVYRDSLSIDISSSDRIPPDYLNSVFEAERKYIQRTCGLKFIDYLKSKGVTPADYLKSQTESIVHVAKAAEPDEHSKAESARIKEIRDTKVILDGYSLSLFDIFSDNNYSAKNLMLYGGLLGLVSGFGIAGSCLLSNYDIQYLFVYIVFMANFHLLEYLTTAMFHSDATLESFVLSHSSEYSIAFIASISEFLVELYLFPNMKTNPIWNFIRYIGFALSVSGQLMRSVSMITAGSNFDHIIATEKDKSHVLVKTGVYSIFRHPSYTGFFYFSLGLQLILFNPICFIGFFFALKKFFTSRIFFEEDTLVEFFGDEYKEYKKTSGIYIPFIGN